ncbi:MAG: class I SAM-dependent methyltransferase, partial [Acidimicrobiia bacterium]|nr:class I SAM-dependent methyltransferase [Acidimicrobiia bacterium]
VEAEFIHHDIFTWEPDDRRFDLIVLAYVHFPEPMRTAAHALAVRCLSPGGKVFVVAHHRDNLTEGVGGPPMAEVLFTEDELRGDFSDLDIGLLERVLRPVDLEDGTTAHAIDVVLMASSG